MSPVPHERVHASLRAEQEYAREFNYTYGKSGPLFMHIARILNLTLTELPVLGWYSELADYPTIVMHMSDISSVLPRITI